jgi:hypothetical protein
LCDGARRAIDTVFLASMIAAIMLVPLLPVGLQTLKHTRQRLRDARHPLVNVLIMFDFQHFRQRRYMREKELEKVLSRAGFPRTHARTNARARAHTHTHERHVHARAP